MQLKRILVVLVVLGLLLPYIPVGIWIHPATGSMRPAQVGCSMSVYGPPTPSEGDVIWYWDDNGSDLIAHRVVDIKNDTLILKGDNREETDDPVNRSQVHAETYYNIDLGIDRDDCIAVTRPLYNEYHKLIGSDKRFEEYRVD